MYEGDFTFNDPVIAQPEIPASWSIIFTYIVMIVLVIACIVISVWMLRIASRAIRTYSGEKKLWCAVVLLLGFVIGTWAGPTLTIGFAYVLGKVAFLEGWLFSGIPRNASDIFTNGQGIELNVAIFLLVGFVIGISCFIALFSYLYNRAFPPHLDAGQIARQQRLNEKFESYLRVNPGYYRQYRMAPDEEKKQMRILWEELQIGIGSKID